MPLLVLHRAVQPRMCLALMLSEHGERMHRTLAVVLTT